MSDNKQRSTKTYNGRQSNDGFKRVGGKRPHKHSDSTLEATTTTKPSYKPREKKEFDPSKPFCKVCKDAGKTEEEYTNHFVRDSTGPDAKVVCPTLLAQACRYCRKEGHTVKYCDALTNRDSQSTQTGERKFKSKRFDKSKNNDNNTTTQQKSNKVYKKRFTNSNTKKNEDDDNVELTTKQIMSNNPFGALHDDDGNDADIDSSSSNASVNDAKNDWDALHNGKTLSYGELKVRCVDGKLVFEVAKQDDTTSSNGSISNEPKTWANVVSSKSS